MSLEEQRAELQRVLHSPQFRRAPKLQKLLELICRYQFENRAQEISEFLIATEAFGKGPGFDPSQDSIVRVQARETRRRLREYYQQDGKTSRLVLEIPIGSYIPSFTDMDPQRATPEKLRLNGLWSKVAAVALVVTAILLAADLGRRRAVAAKAAAPLTPSLARLWGRFVNSEAPTVLVLSNPTVSGCTPDELAAVGAASPQEACPDEYTGIGEAVALYLVTKIFEPAKSKLTVKQSRNLSAEEVRRSNLILLGGKIVNPWTRTLGPDLELTADSSVPLPGLSGYETVVDAATGKLRKDRALIALRRNTSTGHWLLFLYGTHSQGTHAVAEAATNERFLAQLSWPAAHFPDSFRVFVGVSVGEGSQHQALPVAVRVP